jgi:two-component system, cell cycle response regulator CpdR
VDAAASGGFPDFRKLEPNHKALSALNVDDPTEMTSSNGRDPFKEAFMGQSRPLRATALIVEDDPMQREMISLLLEESEVDVIECESAEAAEAVLERTGDSVALMMTDVQLAGNKSGVELAHIARKCNPDMGVIVTSGKPLREELPDGAKFWSKPWAPLDVIREAERVAYHLGTGGDAGPRRRS